jgi:serine/threonine protein kinase
LERRFRAGDRRTVHAYAEELAGLVGSGSPIWSELDRFARDLDGATNSWSPASPDPGFIGKYRVIERIAAGGQATVFRAVHPTLSRDVAIKWSHRTAAEGDRDELVAEGRLLAEIDHPNLVRVHDLDFHEHRPFLVMDYVRGQTLKQFAEHNRLTPRRAAALVALVARAITAVHRRGITHQDLKPQNILITDDGEPKVLDFGLARLRRLWADETDQPGGGTLAYMAPEQARCEFDKVGPWTDVFALGAVLYSLLTDQAPFQDADPLARLERARACLFDKTAMRQAGTPRRLETICLRRWTRSQATDTNPLVASPAT